MQQRNIIESSGHFEADRTKIPLRTTGLFNTEEEIRNVLVDVSRTGQPVYIRDFAEVERRYQDPTFVVRYDGEPCLCSPLKCRREKISSNWAIESRRFLPALIPCCRRISGSISSPISLRSLRNA